MTGIILVDHDSLYAEDLAKLLAKHGYTIMDKVANGREAIQKTEVLHPDLVLMDIFLPRDIDGIEAARHIRENFSIPVVFYTTCSDLVKIRQLLLTKPYGYVLKPSLPQQLIVAIEIALQRRYQEQVLSEYELKDQFWYAPNFPETREIILEEVE